MTRTKPKPLQIEHDRRTLEPPYNSIELSVNDARVIATMRAFPYRLTVWSDGFEAHVDLNADCLRAMREWIDEALEGDDG